MFSRKHHNNLRFNRRHHISNARFSVVEPKTDVVTPVETRTTVVSDACWNTSLPLGLAGVTASVIGLAVVTTSALFGCAREPRTDVVTLLNRAVLMWWAVEPCMCRHAWGGASNWLARHPSNRSLSVSKFVRNSFSRFGNLGTTLALHVHTCSSTPTVTHVNTLPGGRLRACEVSAQSAK